MQQEIRNFSIIAHIDHGKSTLADRIMEQTETINQRESSAQLLDDMHVEQAHGVTVKSRTVRNLYTAEDGKTYILNFIDTPGHVDFSYEVKKSLAASDGAILLVDATQGIQAQTVANFNLAKEAGLKILPVINKIDSPNAAVDNVRRQIKELDPSVSDQSILSISAKTGVGVHEVLEAIVNELPAPTGDPEAPLKALGFDSEYDPYKGVVAYVRIVDGELSEGEQLKLLAAKSTFVPKELGIFSPAKLPRSGLTTGDVGYIVTGLKDAQLIRAGDTVTLAGASVLPLPGYEPVQSVVYAGIYPLGDYEGMKEALERLVLNDPSLRLIPETSDALGPGFRGGFLGVFHLQIIKERLHEEYGVDVLTTAPNVTYRVYEKNTEKPLIVDNPTRFPSYEKIDWVEEPMVKATITTNETVINEVMRLATQHKGQFLDMKNQGNLIDVIYKIPLSEIAYHFFDQLKSISHGYATLTTEMLGFEPADVVKVDIMINYATIDALAFVTHRVDAAKQTQSIVQKLKYTVPRQLYPMPTQAMVEGKSIARVDIPPLRKNAAVNGNKYSLSKKQALLRRQSANKRKAAQNTIDLPQEVFNSLLDIEE